MPLLFFWMIPLLLPAQNQQIRSLDAPPIAMEDALMEYLKIPSLSGDEIKAGTYFRELCKTNGLHIQQFGDQPGNFNFAASLYPLNSGKPNIIFLNHIDVVPDLPSADKKSFDVSKDEDHVYGRGAIDNKGAAIMELFALLRYKNLIQGKDSPYNVSLLSVSCEETQCDGGAAYVVKNHFADLNAAVIIGEGPTEFTSLMEGRYENPIFGISVLHKRTLWLKLSLADTNNGHGSVTPPDYANKDLVAALHRLTRKKSKAVYTEVNTQFLKDLGQHEKGVKGFALRHPKLMKPFLIAQLRKYPEIFALFNNSITLTNISSVSGSINALSTEAVAELDCRLLPETDQSLFLDQMRRSLKNDQIRIEIVHAGSQSTASDKNSIYFHTLDQAIRQKHKEAKTMAVMMPNVNDMGLFRAKGVPCYGTLPVFISAEEVRGIHGSNELIRIQSLHEGSEIYFNFIALLQKRRMESEK